MTRGFGIATGGTVSSTSSSISVTNANDMVLLFSVASDGEATMI